MIPENQNHWTPEIYESRIVDAVRGTRHAGGSPGADEILGYQSGFAHVDASSTAIVLGMTPELRISAARSFRRLLSIDLSEVAISLYTGWLPEDLRTKETIVRGNWTELPALIDQPVGVVLGDGIIGNLAGPEEALSLLTAIREALAPGGCCVMRNVILPEGLDPGRFEFDQLLSDFRSREIDSAEFGFCSRMLGFHRTSYDKAREILDNAATFSQLDAMADQGKLSEVEKEALSRYRFTGSNFFPGEPTWNGLLASAGFSMPERQIPSGKRWSEFYQVQEFHPVF